jgi:hypothetical protein
MHVAQRSDHLEFDNQVRRIFADDHVVAKDHDCPLPEDAEPGRSNLARKGFLVGLFNEPMTEPIGDPESATDYPAGHRLQ